MLLERTIPGISWVIKRIKDPRKSFVEEIKIFYYVLKSLNYTLQRMWGTSFCWRVEYQFNTEQNLTLTIHYHNLEWLQDIWIENFLSAVRVLKQNFIVRHCKLSTISMVSWNATLNAFSCVIYFFHIFIALNSVLRVKNFIPNMSEWEIHIFHISAIW